MEKLKYFVACIGHAFRSVMGFYLHPFNQAWDEHLQHILDEGELITVDKYIAVFSHDDDLFTVWIANRWFAYGGLDYTYNACHPLSEFRPRFRTMYRLHQKVQAWRTLNDD